MLRMLAGVSRKYLSDERSRSAAIWRIAREFGPCNESAAVLSETSSIETWRPDALRCSHRSVGSADVMRRSEEHTSELQSHSDLVCRLLLEKKKNVKHVSVDESSHDRTVLISFRFVASCFATPSSFVFLLFFILIPPPPTSTLFPYTTLFRSFGPCNESAAVLSETSSIETWRPDALRCSHRSVGSADVMR